MKKNISLFTILLLMGTTSNGFASLCTTGQHVGNPHCQSHSSTSGTSSGNTLSGVGSHGQTPDPATQNPQTGSVIPDHHNTQLIPASHKPKLVKTPPSTPKQVTPQVPQPIPQKTPQRVSTPSKPAMATFRLGIKPSEVDMGSCRSTSRFRIFLTMMIVLGALLLLTSCGAFNLGDIDNVKMADELAISCQSASLP